MKRTLILILALAVLTLSGTAQAHSHYWRWHSVNLAPHSTAEYTTPAKFALGAVTYTIRARQSGTVFPSRSPEVHYKGINDFNQFFWLGPLTGTAKTSNNGPLVVRMANFGTVTLLVRVGYRRP